MVTDSPAKVEALLSYDEAQKILGISRATFFKLLARSDLKAVEIGRRRLIEPAELRRFIAAQTRGK